MNNMDLLQNTDLSLNQLLRKRDHLQGLIELGYDLQPELIHTIIAINNAVIKEQYEKTN